MVADPSAFGVRRSAFGRPADAQPTASAPDQTPNAKRQTPKMERCPDCGQPAVLRHKGRRLVRCAACSLAAVRARKRAYHVTHRAERGARRRQGGVACPPYVAWTVEAWPQGVCVVYVQPGCPEASVMPAYGACSCGEAGCVHLVVACLAQQGGGGDE